MKERERAGATRKRESERKRAGGLWVLTRNNPRLPPFSFTLLSVPLYLTSPLHPFLSLRVSSVSPSLSLVSPVAFPRGSLLTLRAPLFMSGVRMLLEDITTGLACLSRFDARVPFRLAASVFARFLARSLALVSPQHVLSRLLSACASTPKTSRRKLPRALEHVRRPSFRFISSFSRSNL